MNLSPRKESRGRNEQSRGFKSRLELDKKVYNSASEALEAYITEFEGGTTIHRRRPSDLLSPAPKFYFMDSVERRLRSSPIKSPARKVDELLEWVNDTYSRELSSKVEPFGYRTTAELPGSDEENMNPRTRSTHSHGGHEGDLSTLPSPSSSVVDLDSNAGTVETDVLLSSFKGAHPTGAYSRVVSYRSPPKSGHARSRVRPDGSTEYPSWVSGLGKEYPSWVEDLDSTAQHRKITKSPGERYSSGTSSTSETDSKRRNVYLRSSRSSPALKVSDLHSRASSSSMRSRKGPSGAKMAEIDWSDGASTDTEMLVSQPLYGTKPVNMGGDLHESLYEDKKVSRLKKESTKKLRKSTGKIKSREQTAVSPRRSKSLSFTPTKTLRFSVREGERVQDYSGTKIATPRGTRDLRDSSPAERSPFTALPSRYSLPPQDERYGPPEQPGRRSVSPRSDRMFASPPAVTRYSISSSKKPQANISPTRQPRATPSRTPARASAPRKIEIPPRNEESDMESDDTDRVMRKSPTGIRMEKMYRDPSTMYPWKSMMQSSSSRDASVEYTRGRDASVEYTRGKPAYHSTPLVYSSKKAPISAGKGPGTALRDSQRSGHRVTIRDPRSQLQYSAGYDVRSTPKPVFASSSYRSRDEKLAKSAPDTRHQKPPPAPRSGSRRTTHRRSKTVPDLRRIAMSSSARPRSLRRSLDDDVISVNTTDTETLITHPPMPVFDVSPSLTTVSDSDTMVDSEEGTEVDMLVTKRGQQSTRLLAPDTTLHGEDDGFSPTSVFASSNPHAAVREELPERFHLWKLDEDTRASDSFIKKRFTSPKSGIISTFLEDCLNVNNDDEVIPGPDVSSPVVRLSGKEAAPGPVEALKQMLFTMQDMAHHDTQHDNGHLDYYKLSSAGDFKSRDTKEFASSEHSDRDLDILRGEVSLQRAYHHLERLKRLVGREDDRSSVSSTNQ